MKKITRNQAAEMLNVHPQTITNYVHEGLLGGYTDDRGRLYLDAEEIEAHADKFKAISVNQRALDRKLQQLKEARRQADEELVEIRRRIMPDAFPTVRDDLPLALSAIFEARFIPRMNGRERSMLCAVIKGQSIPALADCYQVSTERVRQILLRACRLVHSQTDSICRSLQDHRSLQRQVEGLEASLARLHNEYALYRLKKEGMSPGEDTPPDILRKMLPDLPFSMRVLNALHRERVENVGDLLTKYASLDEIKRKVRNLGKLSIDEIGDFIERNRLSFRKPKETDIDFYVRLNRQMKNNDN